MTRHHKLWLIYSECDTFDTVCSEPDHSQKAILSLLTRDCLNFHAEISITMTAANIWIVYKFGCVSQQMSLQPHCRCFSFVPFADRGKGAGPLPKTSQRACDHVRTITHGAVYNAPLAATDSQSQKCTCMHAYG